MRLILGCLMSFSAGIIVGMSITDPHKPTRPIYRDGRIITACPYCGHSAGAEAELGGHDHYCHKCYGYFRLPPKPVGR